MLQLVDTSVLIGDGQMRKTLQHHLADLADPSDYSTHENQLILARRQRQSCIDPTRHEAVAQGMLRG
jgi:hypothetical protein